MKSVQYAIKGTTHACPLLSTRDDRPRSGVHVHRNPGYSPDATTMTIWNLHLLRVTTTTTTSYIIRMTERWQRRRRRRCVSPARVLRRPWVVYSVRRVFCSRGHVVFRYSHPSPLYSVPVCRTQKHTVPTTRKAEKKNKNNPRSFFKTQLNYRFLVIYYVSVFFTSAFLLCASPIRVNNIIIIIIITQYGRGDGVGLGRAALGSVLHRVLAGGYTR